MHAQHNQTDYNLFNTVFVNSHLHIREKNDEKIKHLFSCYPDGLKCKASLIYILIFLLYKGILYFGIK